MSRAASPPVVQGTAATAVGRAFARDRGGASAVELALVLPFLMLLLTGIVQVGSAYLLQGSMQNVARELSLRLATGDLAAEAAAGWAVERLPTRISRYAVEVREVPGDEILTVVIAAAMPEVVMIDPGGLFAGRRLTVQASARRLAPVAAR